VLAGEHAPALAPPAVTGPGRSKRPSPGPPPGRSSPRARAAVRAPLGRRDHGDRGRPRPRGRNSEYLLALAVGLAGAPGITALAGDSDGIDGSEDNAGAVAGPDALERAAAAGIDAEGALAANDAYGFFAALDDLVVTGPTRTNVNDFRAILIE
jgi:hydroxypyruvate reductase